MRLERLICRFLLPGEHTVADVGIGASLAPHAGETVLAFHPVENDVELCGSRGGQPIADALFLWKSDQHPLPAPQERPVLVAVEFKRSLVDSHAFDQVLGLLGVVVRDMQATAVGRLGAVVLTCRAAPQSEFAIWQRRARSLTGVVPEVVSVAVGSTTDIRQWVASAVVARPADLVARLGKSLFDP